MNIWNMKIEPKECNETENTGLYKEIQKEIQQAIQQSKKFNM